MRTGMGERYLLLRAFKYWDFPKGEVGAAEDPLTAARREVLEETTLTGLQFCWGERYYETEPYARGKVARYYLARYGGGSIALPVNPALGRAEHHEYHWMEYRAALSLLVPRVARALEWAHAIIGEPSSC